MKYVKFLLVMLFLMEANTISSQQEYTLKSGTVKYHNKNGEWIKLYTNSKLKDNWIVMSKESFTVSDLNGTCWDCAASDGKQLSILIANGYIQKPIDREGSVRKGEPILTSEIAEPYEIGNTNFHYLLVDVQKFEDSTWVDLQAPKVNLANLDDALRNIMLPENNYLIKSHHLLNKANETTAQSIRQHLKALSDSVRSYNDDVVLLYFSSHGVCDRQGRFQLVATDTRFDSSDTQSLNLIAANELNNFVHQMTSKGAKVLVFVDACNAGSLTDGLASKDVQGSVYYMSTAGNLDAYQDLESSPFAKALIQALSGNDNGWFKKNHNVVTPANLANYISLNVDRTDSVRNQFSQLRLNIPDRNYQLWRIVSKSKVDSLERCILENDANAMVTLGDIYYYGSKEDGINRDYDKAFELYSHAYKLNHHISGIPASKLGVCYYYGTNRPADVQKAFDLFQEAADKGDNLGKYFLSVCYTKGIGVKKDKKKAKQIFAGINNLDNKDIISAFIKERITYKAYYQDQEDSRGITTVAIRSIIDGKGNRIPVKQKKEQKDSHWLDYSWEMGKPVIRTSVIWASGMVIFYPESAGNIFVDKADVSIEQLAELGDVKSQLVLGDAYYDGINFKEKNRQKAVEWYRRAHAQGSSEASYMLGLCYQKGTGVAKDFEKAAGYYEAAAQRGSYGAYINLGALYFIGGDNLAQDYKKAAEYWEKAAKKKYSAGQYNFGVCYLNGLGVPEDIHEAKKWLQKAAKQGYQKAMELLRDI